MQQAERLVARSSQRACALAQNSIETLCEELAEKGHRVVGAAILTGSGRPLPDLRAILASHPAIHTAEGELFRNAIAAACAELRLPVLRIREKELLAEAEKKLALSSQKLRAALDSMGHAIGPPWTQDQKHSALAAWVAMAMHKVKK